MARHNNNFFRNQDRARYEAQVEGACREALVELVQERLSLRDCTGGLGAKWYSRLCALLASPRRLTPSLLRKLCHELKRDSNRLESESDWDVDPSVIRAGYGDKTFADIIDEGLGWILRDLIQLPALLLRALLRGVRSQLRRLADALRRGSLRPSSTPRALPPPEALLGALTARFRATA